MKRNVLLIPFVAVLTLLVASVASAGLATNIDTDFNGVALSGSTMVGDVDDVVPIRVTFDSIADETDVKVKVYMEGHRDDVSAYTNRFDIENGNTYTKLLSLELPSDSNFLSEEYTLYVEIVSQDDKSEERYTVSMQRESYTLEILSVDYSSEVSAGDVFPVSVVVKNIGYNRMDDAYVVVSVPALGVSTRGYVGDIIPTEDYIDYDDEEDSVYRTVYLQIPENAVNGVYDLDVEVYNDDTETSVTKLIAVGGSASSMILAAVKNQDLNAGETITYDMIIVNSADDVKVFNIDSVSSDDLSVSVPSVITVGPDASETIQITVTASSDAEVGTYTFSVDANGQSLVFGANVVGASVSTSVVALTVILAIIFIVLLAVLVVLLTKKERPIEEVETSYY
ncbi:hypothetical protein HN903_00620 [archaeon]|nr:hypothetical protein [archaeon]MBT7128237.1 hypothetical protein [archaeon]MBT7929548.1 hypothetical protein [Candidatus Peregrinibacteria bacterium]